MFSVDRTAQTHRGGDGGERVVQQHHHGGLPGDVGAGGAHGDADVRVLERRGVVGAVPGDGDDLAAPLKGGDHPHLVLGADPAQQQLARPGEQSVQAAVVERVQLGPRRTVGAGSRTMPTRRATASAVSGWSPVTMTMRMPACRHAFDRGPDLRPGRVVHGDEPQERESRLDLSWVGPSGTSTPPRDRARAVRLRPGRSSLPPLTGRARFRQRLRSRHFRRWLDSGRAVPAVRPCVRQVAAVLSRCTVLMSLRASRRDAPSPGAFGPLLLLDPGRLSWRRPVWPPRWCRPSTRHESRPVGGTIGRRSTVPPPGAAPVRAPRRSPRRPVRTPLP